MGEVLFGIKIGVGLAVGLWLTWRVYAWLADLVLTLRFTRAGFTWEQNGWLSRDPSNDDWILWDPENGRMLRSNDFDTQWRASGENLRQCLKLGGEYWKIWKDRLAEETHGE